MSTTLYYFLDPKDKRTKCIWKIGIDSCSKDDFVLILQTEFQKDMLRKFGSLALYIDSTHKTNAYDFSLPTLLVIGNFDYGLPVAWMISNREDKDNNYYTPIFLSCKRMCRKHSSTMV